MPTTTIIDSIRGEFNRYKAYAEGAIAQVDEAQLSQDLNGGNSIAVICWHVSGNLRSRFTDFLTSDGEKPWRQRDEEFVRRVVGRAELMEKWEQGWSALHAALGALTDAQLGSTITIRQQPMTVIEALHRSLSHLAFHVGQIVFLAKALRGEAWTYLSIPPGQSDAYNKDPKFDRSTAHAARIAGKTGG